MAADGRMWKCVGAAAFSELTTSVRPISKRIRSLSNSKCKRKCQLSSKEKIHFAAFTVCNLAYLPKALVLAESVLKHTSQRLKIVIFDRRVELESLSPEAAEILWIEEQEVPDFNELAFLYDIIELSTSLKPFLALKFLEKFQKVLFLDPDTCLYASLENILAQLDENQIVLTPHYTTPQPDNPDESDLPMMRFGSFNLGFFGVRDGNEGLKFLRWWSRRCIDFSFMESQFGLSTDQKWVTIAPSLFRTIGILFNPGYNMAAWNTFERSLSKDSNGGYLVNERFPLVFFHFSNWDPSDPQYLNKRASSEKGVQMQTLLEIGLDYDKALLRMKEQVTAPPYAYDYMSDGKYISPTLRRAYAAVRSELPKGHNPFDANGPVGIFARKNHLLERKTVRYSAAGFKDIREHRATLSAIYRIMRLILWAIGPNRFFSFSRLLVYLSIYRRNRGLWKL